MWIVRIALQRPYTFVVGAIVVMLLGGLSILRMPKDVFPHIDIPIITVVWNYTGLSPVEMANRIVSNHERALTTTVNDIEHVESQSLNGVAVEKIFFQPSVKIDMAVAQVTAISQTLLRTLPPGTTPPLVITYTASSVPILQVAMSGKAMTEQQVFDVGMNFVRTQLVTVEGAAIPFPYGGKQRQIQVDLDMSALQARGLSAADVVSAVNAQNLILPGGTTKIGRYEYDVRMNGSPPTVAELNDLPVRSAGGSTTYVRDVAQVRDGSPPQTNVVHVNGQRAILLTVQKNGAASTLDVIAGVKSLLKQIAPGLPENLDVRLFGDQSLFVRAAIGGVVREAMIAACLTAVMILLFLGSWRSTVIIAVSIPLSILCSIIALDALGETLNIMTLGGLALAVGILVDDATVEIENINRNLAMGKEVEHAILDGAQQIAVPALVSTLCICIVFVPMFFLTGVPRYLFVPLAESVVFAMLASYLLSRTLVPTLAKYLLSEHPPEEHAPLPPDAGFWRRAQHGFENRFEALRERYHAALAQAITHRRGFGGGFLFFCLASLLLGPWPGEDFFPAVDGGQFKLHFRGRAGTRIEETAALAGQIERTIREALPPGEIDSVIDNIGLPYSGINLSYSNSAPVGSADADIMVAFREGHGSTFRYVHDLRLLLGERFPGVEFYFLPADMVSQILNFGLPSPIDLQVVGQNLTENRKVAGRLARRLRGIPGIVDARVHQPADLPALALTVDRTKASQAGLTQREIATDLLVSLSGSFQTAPSFWLDPRNGVSYSIVVQAPQYRLGSFQELGTVPLSGVAGGEGQILGNFTDIARAQTSALVSHYNIQPVIDVYGGTQGRDLGGVTSDVEDVVRDEQKTLPKGSRIVARGQMRTMRSSYVGLLGGLVFSILLVYLLIVVNLQSWLDPFIIVSALPAALAGIVWFLFLTQTTLSVPALIGAIMCMGVATANSILVVSFAREQMDEGKSAAEAALEAGFTRFRPVLMTALAMIMGMLPMAFALGEGGEQNAPLGRAVIGGLGFATVSTLLFVPVVFSWIHGRANQERKV